MRSDRGQQRDLFKGPPPRPELRTDVRAKLQPLLRALLTEAARQTPGTATKVVSNASEKDPGDDQDHA